MIGIFFLWLAIGEATLFLSVLVFTVIEEAFRDRRLRREADFIEQALKRSLGPIAKADEDRLKALLGALVDIAA